MRKTILRNYLYDNALQKTTFLCCKSMVFGVQKPYFYIAKTPFLKLENIHHPKPHRLFIAQMYGNEHSARYFYQFIVPVSSTKTIGFGVRNTMCC